MFKFYLLLVELITSIALIVDFTQYVKEAKALFIAVLVRFVFYAIEQLTKRIIKKWKNH